MRAGVGVERRDAGVAGELCASDRKRSLGPISQSSFAALSGPQPASSYDTVERRGRPAEPVVVSVHSPEEGGEHGDW
jgi:hypothetical protein